MTTRTPRVGPLASVPQQVWDERAKRMRASRSTAPAKPELTVGACCVVPAKLSQNCNHLGTLSARVIRLTTNTADLHFAIDNSETTVSRAQALKWLAAPEQRHPGSSAKRPSDAIAAPSSTKKPKTAAAATTTPARTTPIQEPLLPLPAETANNLPSRDGKWTSSLVDAGGGGRTGSFEAIIDASVALPHTLLVGTQPATKSLANCWYFANDTNAFWHIVGHALRFRRGFHEQARPNGDVVPSIAKHLRGGELHLHEPRDEVCADYEEAVARLQGAGYALWDILSSSVRKSKKSGKQSSLDSDIRTPKAADIEGLVRRHPSIRRIVFVTGKGSADTFRKHFSEW